MLQENGSGAGSPPRLTAEAEHDSVYDAETEPSAGESEAQRDLEDTYQTQRRPAAGLLRLHACLPVVPTCVVVLFSNLHRRSGRRCFDGLSCYAYVMQRMRPPACSGQRVHSRARDGSAECCMRAAGTFGVDETPASQGRLQSQVDGKAPTTRSQAERGNV